MARTSPTWSVSTVLKASGGTGRDARPGKAQPAAAADEPAGAGAPRPAGGASGAGAPNPGRMGRALGGAARAGRRGRAYRSAGLAPRAAGRRRVAAGAAARPPRDSDRWLPDRARSARSGRVLPDQ